MNTQPDKTEVENFLAETEFSDYQSVSLPYGLKTPGRERSKIVDFILSSHVTGKSVLDVGTYYGLFPNEAMKRGALKAIGVEYDQERFEIANRIAQLNGNQYSILNGRIEDINLFETFDIVLFLNVLHHVTDPVGVITKLASLCRGTMIVEFCLPTDPAYIKFLSKNSSFKAKIHSRLLRWIARDLPIMAIGSQEYHRTFYFSAGAFYNLFVIHNKLFSTIRFEKSVWNSNRMVAFCESDENLI